MNPFRWGSESRSRFPLSTARACPISTTRLKPHVDRIDTKKRPQNARKPSPTWMSTRTVRSSTTKIRSGPIERPLAGCDRRPPECRQIHADQPDGGRRPHADWPGSGHHARFHLRRLDLARPAHQSSLTRQGSARKRACSGEAGKALCRRRLRAIKFAEVVVVTLDATMSFEKQDLQIIDLVAREGRALVIADQQMGFDRRPGRSLEEDPRCQRTVFQSDPRRSAS
jgi:hypothetical protein